MYNYRRNMYVQRPSFKSYSRRYKHPAAKHAAIKFNVRMLESASSARIMSIINAIESYAKRALKAIRNIFSKTSETEVATLFLPSGIEDTLQRAAKLSGTAEDIVDATSEVGASSSTAIVRVLDAVSPGRAKKIKKVLVVLGGTIAGLAALVGIGAIGKRLLKQSGAYEKMAEKIADSRDRLKAKVDELVQSQGGSKSEFSQKILSSIESAIESLTEHLADAKNQLEQDFNDLPFAEDLIVDIESTESTLIKVLKIVAKGNVKAVMSQIGAIRDAIIATSEIYSDLALLAREMRVSGEEMSDMEPPEEVKG